MPIPLLVGHDTRPLDHLRRIEDGSPSSLLLDRLPDAVLVVDALGVVQWGNRAAEVLFGRSVETSLGISGLDYVHPEDLELVLRSLESVQSKTSGSLIEIRVDTPSGWRLVELIGSVVDWPNQGCLLLTLRDLTDRRRFEVANDVGSRSLSIVQHSPTLTMLVSREGVVESASGALTRCLGHDPEWVTGRPLTDIVSPDDRSRLTLAIERAAEWAPSASPVTTTVSMLHYGTDERIPFELAFVNLLDDPTIGGFVVSGHDVSLRLQAERKQQESLSLITATLDATADGILVMDRSGYFSSFNRQFARMWRFPQAVLDKRNTDSAIAFIHDQMLNADAVVKRLLEIIAREGDDSYDILEFKDGRVFEARSKAQRIDDEVVGRVWTFRDVTDRKRLEEQLSYQAFHDSLTGLGNRILFHDRMEHAGERFARSGGRLAVMFLDVDRFKPVNDQFGHPAGDALLRTTAQRISRCLRTTDTAARLGGDEFGVLLEDIADDEQVAAIAERLLAESHQPVRLGDADIEVSLSIGIAHAEPGLTTDQLLSRADAAMYQAKLRGGNNYSVFTPVVNS